MSSDHTDGGRDGRIYKAVVPGTGGIMQGITGSARYIGSYTAHSVCGMLEGELTDADFARIERKIAGWVAGAKDGQKRKFVFHVQDGTRVRHFAAVVEIARVIEPD